MMQRTFSCDFCYTLHVEERKDQGDETNEKNEINICFRNIPQTNRLDVVFCLSSGSNSSYWI